MAYDYGVLELGLIREGLGDAILVVACQLWHVSHGMLVMAYWLWHLSYGALELGLIPEGLGDAMLLMVYY